MKKRIFAYIGLIILLFTSLFPITNVLAQGTLNVDVDVSNISETVSSGQDALYRLNFKVTGVEASYTNAKLIVNIPREHELDIENMPLESVAINGVTPDYNRVSNTLIYNLGTVKSGINQSLILKVLTKNGSTPDGTILTLDAKFSADNFSGNATSSATIKVTASNTISTSKTITAITDGSGKKISRPPSKGDLVTWTLKIVDIKKESGLLYLQSGSNIVIKDTLPAGLDYVSDDSGGKNSNGIITWTVSAPSLVQQEGAVENLFEKVIQVKTKITSSTNFSTLTNRVQATATDINGNKVTNESSASITMGMSNPSTTVPPSSTVWYISHGAKGGAGFINPASDIDIWDTSDGSNVWEKENYKQDSNPNPTLFNDQTWMTGFNVGVNQANSRTNDLTKYEIKYSIDPNLNLSNLYVPSYVLSYDAALSPRTPLTGASRPKLDIYITVNGQEYKAVTEATDSTTYQMSTIFSQLGLPQNSHVSKVRYNYTYAPAGMFTRFMTLNFTIKPGYVGTVKNTVAFHMEGYDIKGKKVVIDTATDRTTIGNQTIMGNSKWSQARTANIVSRPNPGPPVAISKITLDSEKNGVVDLGPNRVVGTFSSVKSSTSNMNGPFSSVVLLPKGVTVNENNPDYQLCNIAGSWDNATNDGNNANGTLKIISNDYNGTGQQQVLVNWTSDMVMSPGQELKYAFNVNIDETASSPLQLYTFGSSSDSNLTVPTDPKYITDSFLLTDNGSDNIANLPDLNCNGNTNDKLVKSGIEYNLLSSFGLKNQKEVKGNLDSSFSDFGHVTPGGKIDYRVSLSTRNQNQALVNFVFVDVLPSVGDLGITDNIQRKSKFTPQLTGAISIPEDWKSHVTVYYSTAKNPSRNELIAHVKYPATTAQMTDPSGAELPNWKTEEQVTDWSKIHSFMIKQNTGDVWKNVPNLSFTFQVQAPSLEKINANGEQNALDTSIAEKERAAWNSFAYQENFSQVIEPLKVGVVLRKNTGKIYLLKFESGTTEDIDNDGNPDIDEEYHLTKGNVLSNAEFDLVDSKGNIIGHHSTDEKGQILFSDVPYGDYTLVETKAPAGYELLKKPIHVTVSSDNDGNVVVFAANNKQVQLPNTGGTHPIQLTIIFASGFGILGLSILGGKALLDSKRKRKDMSNYEK
ncbi:SpaA isopeptide-forming pilin-related protein [Lactococcus petauri]|uniref:SpaA isopeptide-forming pilin-related protein n=1 Tax=Lactococcus petauri TaxID=1940789 RepID=UPI00254B4E5F|nr:SpaA isopeptide-forming pilin-related protein [Lactococcus petauri]